MNIFTTKILSILGVFLAFIVIGLGAWTRLADAGLGCPDWPGCYGFITFPTTSQEIEMAEQLYPDSPVEIDKIIPEVVHRYFAASLGLLAIFLLFISIKEKKHILTSSLLLAIIIGQGIFGYLTVSLKLHPLIVTTHLFGAMITTSIFLVIFLRSLKLQHNFEILKANRHLIIIPNTNFKEAFNLFQTIGPNYLFGQMSNEARVAIHITHRIGAIVVFLYSLFLIFKLKSKETLPVLGAFGAILFLQVFLGINNVLSHLPLWNAVAHNIFGVMLFLCMIVIMYLSYRKVDAAK